MIFCDTSAIAKLYVRERESVAMRARLESEDQVCVSELARVELMGVFHRMLREKQWDRPTFLTAIRQFSNDDLGGFWTWLPLDDKITEAAAKTYATLLDDVFLVPPTASTSAPPNRPASRKSIPTTATSSRPRRISACARST